MTTLSAASGLLTLPPRPRFPLAASHLPRGRILVFENQTVIALDLQRILREAGYRIVGPATSLAEADVLLGRGRLDGAVIDVDAGPGWQAADLVADTEVPFVLIGRDSGTAPPQHVGRPFVEKPYDAEKLLEALERAGAVGRFQKPSATGDIPFPRVWPQL